MFIPSNVAKSISVTAANVAQSDTVEPKNIFFPDVNPRTVPNAAWIVNTVVLLGVVSRLANSEGLSSSGIVGTCPPAPSCVK